MKRIVNVLLGVLFFWFTLDITGFSLGKFCLVESPGVLSVDAVWWLIFFVCIILFLLREKQGKYVLAVFLLLWIILQYFSHWYYTLFGASERKLKGYNNYFRNTYHVIAPSDSILIPDLYHIVLHLLIFTLFVLVIGYIFNKRKK